MSIRNKLLQILQADKILPLEKLTECMDICMSTGDSLDKVLVERGYLTEVQMLKLFSACMGYPYHEKLVEKRAPDPFLARVPIQFARSHCLCAVRQDNGTMEVATAAPLETHAMDELALMLDCEIQPVFSTRTEITSLINRSYQQKVGMVDEMLDEIDDDELAGIAKEVEQSTDVLEMANKAPIIKLVNMVMFNALRMRASDIHLQPFEDRLQVRYRIDGILYDREAIPKKVQEGVLSRVKVMGKMDIAERRLPQDGRATIRVGDSEVDVRISSVPTSHGERIVLRILDKTARLLELSQIGLDQDNLDIIKKVIDCTHGIIFVTGPTGSGKTTTLYAALQKVDTTENNVLTIEDPIEYQLPGVSQIEVSTKKGLTFARGLRSIVRQDPDIIFVGEVRDLETAEIAIQSALTGHLVFSTLHTNDSAGAVTRLLDLGVEPYLVASSLICAIAQRLVRVICMECKEPLVTDPSVLESIGIDPERARGKKLYHGRGCGHCFSTGYHDRTGIYEIMLVNDRVREQIIGRSGSNTIKQEAVVRGLRTLRMDGAQKVLDGLTTAEEVMRVTQMDIS